MVLDKKTEKRILDFIRKKPRTVQEVALLIRKNWRTADSYLQKISQETGSIAFRIFRAGTRGALKIAYWNSLESMHSSQAQELLFKRLEVARKKEDFSPFDIYQYVDKNKRAAFFEEQEEEMLNVKQDLVGSLMSAQQQVLIFSGNISWANLIQGRKKLIDVFRELAERNVSVKIVADVDMHCIDNAKKVNAINSSVGKDRIEVRHCEQPLRAFIVDDRVVKIKEIKDPKEASKRKRTYIFYEIYDEEWVEWLKKVFWHFFASGIPLKKRVEDLKTVKRI
ncbi:MAG: hypothetical protein ABIB71_09540 [Candidatus Woesearchaeota archaeon]